MWKPKVKSFEVRAANGGFTVHVEHAPKPPQAGKGLKSLMGVYTPPQMHVHTSKGALHKYLRQLTDQMSLGDKDGDGPEVS